MTQIFYIAAAVIGGLITLVVLIVLFRKCSSSLKEVETEEYEEKRVFKSTQALTELNMPADADIFYGKREG
jgi:hypothetical protein